MEAPLLETSILLSSEHDAGVRPWIFELEAILLLLLVLGIYFTRLTTVSIRGEESRWATVAREMVRTGDWVVPRQQGLVFADRPPLNSWCMALIYEMTGRLDRLAIRLPTALATLLTTLLVYVYSRTFLSRLGALSAGAAYATMPQVLQLGRFAESDALFSFFVAASLLVWHLGYTRKWPPACVWCCGYLLAALAALTKGPQGPVYFLGPVLIFLLLRRDWRYLLSLRHLAGVAALAAVLGAWQIPFTLRTGLEATAKVWSEEGNLADRLRGILDGSLPLHLVAFPAKVFLYLLPWSVLLLAFGNGRFRRSLRGADPQVLFLVVWFLVVFPTCWLVPSARPRYLMSALPCLACLIGLVVQWCCETSAAAGWQKLWAWFLAVLAVGTAVLGLAGLGVGVHDLVAERKLLPPAGFMIVYGLICLGLAAACIRTRKATTAPLQKAAVLCVASFLGLTYNGPVVNGLVRADNTMGAAVARVKQQLPPGEPLVSFGFAHHQFVYYFGDRIKAQPWPDGSSDWDPRVRYFCFPRRLGGVEREVPFAWEQIAEISCERYPMQYPRTTMVIGRRVDAPPMVANPKLEIRNTKQISRPKKANDRNFGLENSRERDLVSQARTLAEEDRRLNVRVSELEKHVSALRAVSGVPLCLGDSERVLSPARIELQAPIELPPLPDPLPWNYDTGLYDFPGPVPEMFRSSGNTWDREEAPVLRRPL
jgi:4-amino-4-deoxy-L-arabinose transferase-like glycosyltransferase